MPRLPRDLSAREVMQALGRIGFRFVRRNGSHCILKRNRVSLIVPDHKRLDTGTLRSIIRDAGLSVEEFVSLL